MREEVKNPQSKQYDEGSNYSSSQENEKIHKFLLKDKNV